MDDGEEGVFEGYDSVLGGVNAVNATIIEGAYSKGLKADRMPAMFINHDSHKIPVGDWLDLKEDEHGLYGKGKIDLNHIHGPMVYSALKRKAVDALSIGFSIPKGGAIFDDNGIRELHQIKLHEISIVNFPADQAARISHVKNFIKEIQTYRDAETLLRDSGFSRSEAVSFVSCLKSLVRSDSETEITTITKDKTNELINIINRL